jgi:hypothetical protein
LAVQVQLEAGDGTQNIEEMVVLCRELLTSTSSARFPNVVVTFLTLAVDAEFFRGRVQSVDQVIECLRDATKMCPRDSHDVFFTLARILCTRFTETHSNDDYEEATALLERILDPDQPGECPDQMRDRASSLATQLAYVLKKRTPILHNLFKSTFHLPKAWKGLGNFFSYQMLFGDHIR